MSLAHGLEPSLAAVDRLAIRWAEEEYQRPMMHILERMRIYGCILPNTPAPTPDDIRVFDEVFRASPAQSKAVVLRWYCQELRSQST